MDALRQYGTPGESSDSSGDANAPLDTLSTLRGQGITSAPAVTTNGLVLSNGEARLASEVAQAPGVSARSLRYNPTFDELYGGERSNAQAVQDAIRNHTGGHVEDASVPSAVFEEQYHTFHARGAAADPSGRAFAAAPPRGHTNANNAATDGATAAAETKGKRQRSEEERAAKAAKRAAAASAAQQSVTEQDAGGVWRLKTVQPWADKESKAPELNDEQKAYLAKVAADKAAKEAAKSKETPAATTQWHGAQAKDWQGKSWIAASKKAALPPDVCFLPKRWVHTWGADGTGHTKGVNCIRFFPKTGHLLLSAGLDSKVKVWDVHGSGKCMRTYLGHTAGVRQANFNHDGTKFVTVSYDKQMHWWDTETGQVIQTVRSPAVFYCATLNPDPAKESTVLAGASDKKIYQFDLTSGEMIQEYHYHLGAVNTIEYIEEDRMFASTADDKTIRVWELGVPVQVKVIADPAMHSMPAAAKHPSGKWLCYQSLDSQIVTYGCSGKFRQNKKKVFKGHLVGGNACQVNFSPDGKFLMSGDSVGKLFFWEWAHPNRVVKTLPAHDKVACIGCQWHPLETSKVATCGWDGLIKYWD